MEKKQLKQVVDELYYHIKNKYSGLKKSQLIYVLKKVLYEVMMR